MRFTLAAAGFLLSSVMTVSAQTPAPPAPSPPGATYDIPADSKPQTVVVHHGMIPAGQINPIRVHPGVEMGYIAQGDMKLWFKDKPPHVYHTGDAFFIGRGEQYQVQIVSAVPVILYNTLATDTGVPPSEIVEGPPLVQ